MELFENLLIPSPLEKISTSFFGDNEVYIKREDLIHPIISGNKYRKLKFNLEFAIKNNCHPIISFGGAFSNHLAALAYACNQLELKCIGIIRGEEDLSNPSIQNLLDWKMKLEFVSRLKYKVDNRDTVEKEYQEMYPHSLIIPEGGTNNLAISGVKEMMDELEVQLPNLPDIIGVSLGSGGTSAGILNYANDETEIIVSSSFRGSGQKTNYLEKLKRLNVNIHPNLNYLDQYHFGGYARFDSDLIQFIHKWERETNILLDPIYTAKMFYAVADQIKNRNIKNKTIVLIHTGGLQGRKGFEYRHGPILKAIT